MDSDSGARTETARDASGTHESIWVAAAAETDYPRLGGDRSVDTAIVGGGIVGITAARRLKDAGNAVAVVEADRIGRGVTAHSTAKLTSQHGLVYRDLISAFGEDAARGYAAANEAAIDEVESRIEEHGIDAEFHRAAAYTYTTSAGGRRKIRDEVAAARRLDLPASYTESTPLPYDDDVEAAVVFEDQAYFNPRKYVLGLAAGIPGDGCHVFEETTARAVHRGRPCRVVTDRGTIVADDVVVATHFPFYDRGLYFSRLTPKRSYLLAARLDGPVPEGMFYRHGDPYFSVRPHPAGEESMVLVGGQNHRTGHGGPAMERYRKLEREAGNKFDVAEVAYRWSAQDYVSVDGVPFVGRLAPQTRNVYVATGFGGWGLSNGTAAGMLLSDLVLGRDNEWRTVFRPTRINPLASLGRFVEHNSTALKHFFGDRLTKTRGALGGLSADEAAIVDGDDGPVAAYRDEDGDVHAVSAVCTHLDCHVTWNDAERTWDCPCHGSRFRYDGAVLEGPANDPLPEAEVEQPVPVTHERERDDA